MWSGVEINVGIICGCVPSLKPLVSRVIPRLIRNPSEYTKHENSQDRYSYPLRNLNRPQHSQQQHLPPYSLQTPPPILPGDNGHTERPAESEEDVENNPVNIVEFLNRHRESYPVTSNTKSQKASSTHFFDFVNFGKTKSLLKLNSKEIIPAFAIVTFLFFIWGFAYGLLNALNTQFQVLVRMSKIQVNGLHAAYFAGYIIGPICGRWILRQWGFKRTFVTGLCVYACGVLVFWPSAILASFVAFVISNLIVGSGLAVVETASNSFITLCGPMEYSETRLNIAQGFQAMGIVVSPILAKRVLFDTTPHAYSLIDVQWTYLGIALFDVLLAVLIHYLPIPEVSDEELEELASQRSHVTSAKFGQFPISWVTFGFGFLSIYLYMSGQEMMNMKFQDLAIYLKPE